MKKIGLVLAMLFLLCCFSYAAEDGYTAGNEVTVTGELVKIFVIGGETTGWAIKLDQPLNVEGKELSLIEIDMMGKKINLIPFEHQYVRVTGKLVKRTGIERGHYWVIEVEKFETKLIME